MGDFELLFPIGRGATGEVWKAHRTEPAPQVVALKCLRAEARGKHERRAIRHEAELLSAIRHRNIVEIVDVIDDGDSVAVAMQLAGGGSLASLLASRGQLDARETVAILAPIADALWAIHRCGVVHGDVKPANILFTEEGVPLLADFDVARAVGSTAADELVAGTTDYLAPEVLYGGSPSPRSDIYSLGVVCCEALVGYVPHTGALPAMPLAKLVMRATSSDPRGRFASAGQLARALRRAVAQTPLDPPRRPTCYLPLTAELASRPTVRFGPEPPTHTPKRRRWHRLLRRLFRPTRTSR